MLFLSSSATMSGFGCSRRPQNTSSIHSEQVGNWKAAGENFEERTRLPQKCSVPCFESKYMLNTSLGRSEMLKWIAQLLINTSICAGWSQTLDWLHMFHYKPTFILHFIDFLRVCLVSANSQPDHRHLFYQTTFILWLVNTNILN